MAVAISTHSSILNFDAYDTTRTRSCSTVDVSMAQRDCPWSRCCAAHAAENEEAQDYQVLSVVGEPLLGARPQTLLGSRGYGYENVVELLSLVPIVLRV